MTLQNKGDRPSYSEQCLIAVGRALDKDDEYALTIEDTMEEGGLMLERWSNETWGVPVYCCQIPHESSELRLRMDEVERLGAKSGLIRAYRRAELVYRANKPLALFARLSHPNRLNVVVHSLNNLRTGHDPAVLHWLRVDGSPLYIEKRTTFCKLLASVGEWSTGRDHRVVPFEMEGYEDLRQSRPENILRDAKALVARWGMRRTYSVAFKHLSDEEFVKTVMEMQMKRRLERGDWQ